MQANKIVFSRPSLFVCQIIGVGCKLDYNVRVTHVESLVTQNLTGRFNTDYAYRYAHAIRSNKVAQKFNIKKAGHFITNKKNLFKDETRKTSEKIV